MTDLEKWEEYRKCSIESEERLVKKLISLGCLAELESRAHFPERFNNILTDCKDNTAILERMKPDILMLTSVFDKNYALYVECKTRIPKYYKSKTFTINVQQVKEYKKFEENNNIKTLLAFEDPNCCYIDYLDNYILDNIQPGKFGSSEYHNVYEKDIISIENFMSNIDLRTKLVLEKKI